MTHDMISRADAIAALKSAKLPFGYGQAVYAITNVPAAQVAVKPLEWIGGWAKDPITYETIHFDDKEKQRKYDEARTARIRSALIPTPAPDPANIREAALREALVLVRGYLDAWDDTAINGSSISIICDAIEALITTPPAVSDDVAAVVDAAKGVCGPLWRLILQTEYCYDNPCGVEGCECNQKYDRIAADLRAALAKMKGGA